MSQIDEMEWAKIFKGLTYNIDPDGSVWGHDTECFANHKELSKEFAERIKEALKMKNEKMMKKKLTFTMIHVMPPEIDLNNEKLIGQIENLPVKVGMKTIGRVIKAAPHDKLGFMIDIEVTDPEWHNRIIHNSMHTIKFHLKFDGNILELKRNE